MTGVRGDGVNPTIELVNNNTGAIAGVVSPVMGIVSIVGIVSPVIGIASIVGIAANVEIADIVNPIIGIVIIVMKEAVVVMISNILIGDTMYL